MRQPSTVDTYIPLKINVLSGNPVSWPNATRPILLQMRNMGVYLSAIVRREVQAFSQFISKSHNLRGRRKYFTMRMNPFRKNPFLTEYLDLKTPR